MRAQDAGFAEAFSDEVFEIDEWQHFVPIENCNIMRSHHEFGIGEIDESIQSISNLSHPGNDIHLDNGSSSPYSSDFTGDTGHITIGNLELEEDLKERFTRQLDYETVSEFSDMSDSDSEYFSACEDSDDDEAPLYSSVLFDCNLVAQECEFAHVSEDTDLTFSAETEGEQIENVLLGNSHIYGADIDVLYQVPESENYKPEVPQVPESSDYKPVSSKPKAKCKERETYEHWQKYLYNDYIYSHKEKDSKLIEETDDNVPLWSILTDTMYYTNDTQKCDITYKQPAKQKYFKADNNNKPNIEATKFSTKLDRYLFSADECNEPCSIQKEVEAQPLDERYGDMEIFVSDIFDPDKSIGATYLWSEEDAMSTSVQDSWFTQGKIPINMNSETTGYLLDKTPIRVKTLMDSGASKPMISKKFYDEHPFLHRYPKYPVKPRGIKVANNDIMKVNECVHIMIKFHGHVFEIIAYLVPDMCDDFDFIVGQKTMYELESGPHFGQLSFNFMQRSIPLIATEDIFVGPNKSKITTFRMESAPADFYTGKGIVKLKTERHDQYMQTLHIQINNRTIEVECTNHSPRTEKISKGSVMGCVDMRSLGYFHIQRDTLQAMVTKDCSFLNEEETVEYFSLLIKDHNKLHNDIQNTRLKNRKDLNMKDSPDTNIIPDKKKDPYPWLEPDDPRRSMTDQEIIEKYVDLSESCLTDKEKKQVYRTLLKYKSAFSLRDEIGLCPNMEVELELTDTSPFFIRPFPVKENEKDLIDKEMRKGCLLGILRKGMSSYSSPIMLIPRKLSGIPRIVTDFRHLNSRLVTLQPSIPLVRDAIQILGSSGCEVISVIDLRDAYHTLRLSPKSQRYCGITPYYGSDTYLYQRLGMGLSVSPAVWQNFIQKVLNEIPQYRKHHLAIMDDCLVHSKRKDHMQHLINLFEALIRNGLKISPKKCQLFRQKLVYMGHTLLVEEGIPKITPLKTRVEAILKLDPPKNAKGCKQFCGMVNYLSIFLKDLQEKLIPIYQLTRKGVPFYWTEEHQKAFDDIKHALTTPPVLVMPNDTGHFVLVSDTSTIACGCALYQLIDGRYRLIAYYSKKLPDAVKRYSISELELTGMLANISAFKHILKNANFTVYCDHSALVHILQAKRQAPTLRLQKLIENLSGPYTFKINFLKGKEMHVADFLSRHPDNDTDSPHEIIPIAFLAKEIMTPFVPQWQLKDYLYMTSQYSEHDIVSHACDTCAYDMANVTTRSMSKAANAPVPEIFPLRGENRRPENVPPPVPPVPQPIPPTPMPIPVADPAPVPQPDIPDTVPNVPDVHVPVSRPLPPDEGLFKKLQPISLRPLPSLPSLPSLPTTITQKVPLEPQFDPKQRRIPTAQYEGLLKPLPIDIRLTGQLPPYDMERELEEHDWIPTVDDLNREKIQLFNSIPHKTIYAQHVPKQVELNRFIDVLKKKVIHDYKIPVSVKELRTEYHTSPFFQDIYKYIMKGFCRFHGKAQRLFKMQCEDYVILNGVLFKIRYDKSDKGNPSLVLCVPERYIPTILHQYHDTLLAGHPGVTKLHETIKKKYYFPGMYTIIRQYITTCLQCESRKEKSSDVRIHYPRIPLDYRPMSRLSLDIKHMPRSSLGYKYILLCTCEATNWVVGIPIINEEAATIAEALFFKVICVFGTPKAVICDEAPALTSYLMKAYFHALNINPYYISPMNHGSNRTERYIRTLNDILCKHLSGTASQWPLYVYPACYAMNTQVSLITGYSPYEMVFIQEPPDLFNFDFNPDKSGLKVDSEMYMSMMKNRHELMKKLIQERKTLEAQSQYYREQRHHPNNKPFSVGDLVYLYHGYSSELQAPSKKLQRNWIGPLRIQSVLDDSHYVVSDWSGQLVGIKVHINRLKPCTLNLGDISKDGLLETASNTRKLFQKWTDIVKNDNVI